MVRLSVHMGSSRILQPAAMARTLCALLRFMPELDCTAAIALMPVATAAVRAACNQCDFLKRVKNVPGLTISVIPGLRAAETAFLGVIKLLPIQNA